jgi:hypothetical protein
VRAICDQRMDPESSSGAPIGGIRQKLSASDLAGSVDVRSTFAFANRVKAHSLDLIRSGRMGLPILKPGGTCRHSSGLC